MSRRRHRLTSIIVAIAPAVSQGRSSSMGDYFPSSKGDKLYYVAGATEGGYNINVVDLKEGETKVLLKGMAGSLYPDKKGENLFVLSWNGIKKVNLGNSEVKDVEFDAPYDRKPSLERENTCLTIWPSR